MKEVTLYKCEICGKESRNKEKIISDEIKCKEEAKLAAIRLKKSTKWEKDFLDNFSINEDFKTQINEFLKKSCGDEFEELNIDIQFDPSISCSHFAPMGERTNWAGRHLCPTAFAGFSGSVTGKYSKKGYSFNDYCNWSSRTSTRIPCLHTGTGSGNQKRFQFYFYAFAQDFAHLSKDVAIKLLMK